MGYNVIMAVIPAVLLGGLTATANQTFAWGGDGGGYWGQGWNGGGPCCGPPGYEIPGGYSNGCNAGISDAVYDHDNGLAYNPIGQCLPCHYQVYWDGFRHGYDTQWNSYQVQTQNTDQRVNNYIQVWGNNNYVNTETGQSSNQGQDQNPPIPGPVGGPDP